MLSSKKQVTQFIVLHFNLFQVQSLSFQSKAIQSNIKTTQSKDNIISNMFRVSKYSFVTAAYCINL